jgi:hypothetical protein
VLLYFRAIFVTVDRCFPASVFGSEVSMTHWSLPRRNTSWARRYRPTVPGDLRVGVPGPDLVAEEVRRLAGGVGVDPGQQERAVTASGAGGAVRIKPGRGRIRTSLGSRMNRSLTYAGYEKGRYR